MKTLNNYLNEALIKKDTKLGEAKPKDPGDPSTWQVGDILCGVWSYSMTIPYFYKILKRTSKSFTLAELDKKLSSGHYNGMYEEIPDEKKIVGKPQNVRINKWGSVKVGRVSLSLWDGKPVSGCDLD